MKLTSRLSRVVNVVLVTAGLVGCANIRVTPRGEAFSRQVIFQGVAAEAAKQGDYNKARAWSAIGDNMGRYDSAEVGRSNVQQNVYGGNSSQAERAFGSGIINGINTRYELGKGKLIWSENSQEDD